MTQLLLMPFTLTVSSVEKNNAVTLCHLLLQTAYSGKKLVTFDTTLFPISTDITTAPFCSSRDNAGLPLDVDILNNIPLGCVVLNSKLISSCSRTLKFLSEIRKILSCVIYYNVFDLP